METLLTIRLFGPMLVLIGDTPLPRMRSRKSMWLLALLSTRANRSVIREWVASTLWPDVDLATAFANLRPVLSDLRHALGDHGDRILSFDRNTVGLNLTCVDHDVARFDAAISQGDFSTAVRLYTGSFLEGCNEEWVPQERLAREFDCLRALQFLGDQASEAGDYDGALAHFSRAVALDPWRDATRRGLMQAFAGKGDVNAALHTYREFAHFLSANAAVQPDEITSDLYQRLRARAKTGNPMRGGSQGRRGDARCPLCRLGTHERDPQEQQRSEGSYCFDGYSFFPERQLLLKDGSRERVGARALDLLHVLLQRAGELVSKEELIRYCWPDTFIHENNLMVNIAALRRVLSPINGLPYIVTVPGRGYRFVAPVRIEKSERFERSPSAATLGEKGNLPWMAGDSHIRTARAIDPAAIA